MPLMRSVSNHPYEGKPRPRGTIYEVADKDVELMLKLKRVERVRDDDEAAQTYKTRELQAQPETGIISSRGIITPEQIAQRPPRTRRSGGTPPDAGT